MEQVYIFYQRISIDISSCPQQVAMCKGISEWMDQQGPDPDLGQEATEK